MLENFFKASADNDVINNYLRLLAQRQIQLESQVEQLTTELRRGHLQFAELALLNAKDGNPQVTPLIVDTLVRPELMTLLLGYLPAIFPNFWNTVSPDELAKMTSMKEKPMIPSPFTYPESRAVAAIIEHIQSLPDEDQIVIANICYILQKRYGLRTHPFSHFWLKEMEK
ncbi:hypothetical protein [Methylovulum psychrotolerans]|uniref:Uncharacterized protein n=1 Tax=Methylovulum psychrotolerans TaxID=1704499 RepID=A0A2S5CIV4_9GAMM|nr:hypothetical protein [Methylovulum psychrotolerans]POZ50735.1 hypothetical protein AADEFJLK_03632 [Methylovulum psychrotolerans]